MSGFFMGLVTGFKILLNQDSKKVDICRAIKMSSIVELWGDRTTCIILVIGQELFFLNPDTE